MTVKINSFGRGVGADNISRTAGQPHGDICKYTKDSVEISGRECTDTKGGFDYGSLFARVDGEIALAKQSCREHAENQLKKKVEKEQTQRRQRPRIEAKKALMKESGVLWTGGLTAQSQQMLMQKSPGLLAEYAEKQKEKQEEILKSN